WDQAYMTASMFKAVMAELYMDSSRLNGFLSNPVSIKWRILGVQYDKLGLSERGYRPAQIQWYRETARKIDEKIKKLLEYDYPIGNEIYRDETGIYFLIAEILGEGPKDNELLGELHPDLNEIYEKILQIFKDESLDEFYPAIFVTKASRGLMTLGYLIDEARTNFLKADWSKKENDICLEKSISGRSVGICQLCGHRLVFESDRMDEDKDICGPCYENKTRGRIKEWLKDTSGETIWMDELKDEHGRVALVTMKFELKHWLNGNMLNTLVLQNGVNLSHDIADLKRVLMDIYKNNGQDRKVEATVLKNYIDGALHSHKIKERKIIESLLLERSIGDEWEKLIYKGLNDWDDSQNVPLKQKIDFDNRKIVWPRLTEGDIEFISAVLLQLLLRKNPSPARLRRVWESTKEFFEEIERNICDYAGIPEERKIRYYWYNSGIPEGEYYDGDAIFWSDPQNTNRVYLISYLKDLKETFELKRYGERYSSESEEYVSRLCLRDGKKETYRPYMSIIDPTPVSWQFIIPAKYVPNLIDNVMKKYDEHFKFVYGKLPLHIGVVVQDYKKPLYVGIKALRRIRRDIRDIDTLQVKVKASQVADKLKCQRFEEKINDTQNYYSLYWGEHTDGYEFYLKMSGDEKFHKEWICCIDKIEEDRNIYIIPNTFDFEFLDTNVRRNDIRYVKELGYKRAVELKSNRPYEIETYWGRFKAFKEIFGEGRYLTKLQKLVTMIYDGLDLEENSLAGFMTSAFINVLELKKDKNMLSKILKILDINESSVKSDNKLDIDKLYEQLAVKLNWENLKLFLDMFEFWHRLLKEV
nr:CRISPR-associated protein Csx11 [Clostridia bacterium]